MRFRWMLPLFLTLIVSGTTVAQACDTLVNDALMALSESCAETGRNQACYGNGLIDLITQPTITDDIAFDVPGDTADVEEIQRLTLYPLDVEEDVWGISLLRVQASLPDTLPGQNVTMLLFGDAELTNAANTMEAVYFRSGIGAPQCNDAPNGLLIQTPEGVGEVTFTLNEIEVTLGSTAYLTADADDLLTFNLLEGEAVVFADDTEQTVESGQFVTVPLDEDLSPSGPPSVPEAIDWSTLPMLPLGALPLDITDLVYGEDGAANIIGTTDSDVPDEVIIPQTGTWVYTRGDLVTSSGCPPMMNDVFMQSAPLTDAAFVDFGGEPLDFENFLTMNSDEPLPGGEFLYPEPNVYQWTMSEEGVNFVYELRLLSEVEIEGTMSFDINAEGISCQIDMPFNVQLDE